MAPEWRSRATNPTRSEPMARSWVRRRQRSSSCRPPCNSPGTRLPHEPETGRQPPGSPRVLTVLFATARVATGPRRICRARPFRMGRAGHRSRQGNDLRRWQEPLLGGNGVGVSGLLSSRLDDPAYRRSRKRAVRHVFRLPDGASGSSRRGRERSQQHRARRSVPDFGPYPTVVRAVRVSRELSQAQKRTSDGWVDRQQS